MGPGFLANTFHDGCRRHHVRSRGIAPRRCMASPSAVISLLTQSAATTSHTRTCDFHMPSRWRVLFTLFRQSSLRLPVPLRTEHTSHPARRAQVVKHPSHCANRREGLETNTGFLAQVNFWLSALCSVLHPPLGAHGSQESGLQAYQNCELLGRLLLTPEWDV